VADERTLARRYARALLGVAREANKIDEVEKDLYALAELWSSTEGSHMLFAHPGISRERKKEILTELLKGKIDPITLRFVEVLVDNQRFRYIEQIAHEYDHISDELQEISKATVTSFMPLNDKQRKALHDKLSGLTRRRKVELDEKVDAALLGGIVIQVGSFVVDGSVAGRLRKLRERLVLPPDELRRQAAQNMAEARA